MSEDDPFGTGDPEKTVIRPTPGGRRSAVHQQLAPAGPRARASYSDIRESVNYSGINPIVAAAQPILSLCAQLRNTVVQGELEQLRQRVIQGIEAFDDDALSAGASGEAVRIGRYALCATIDDLVLNTPWGNNSTWTRTTMVLTFFNETSGGKRFFEILNRFERNPGPNIEVLELMYICLSIGFEGELRIDPRGASEHNRVRDSIFRAVREFRGEFEQQLSPSWRGIDAGHRPLSSYVPTWVIGVCTAAIVTGIFMGFSLALNDSSDETYRQLSALPPTGTVSLGHSTPAPVARTDQFSRIQKFLEKEILHGLVTVLEDPTSITIRIHGSGLFASGSDSLHGRFLPLLGRVGEALEREPGQVAVAGHTDSIPIRTIRFPSNWHLSLARAEAVLRILSRQLSDSSRLVADGRADTEPVAPNDTPNGRERNRRIELILLKRG
jgi:type VI secretion system protein ImpK